MKAFVLTFDQLRSSFLGCYGQLRSRTPTFDQLAAQSIVFDQHFLENVDPAAARHAWTSGCYQFPDSAVGRSGGQLLGDVLRDAGVAVTAIREWGARRIFEGSGIEPHAIAGGEEGFDAAPETTRLGRVVERAIEEFAAHRGAGRSLLWVHGRGASLKSLPPWNCVRKYAGLLDESASVGEGGETLEEPGREEGADLRGRVERFADRRARAPESTLTEEDWPLARLLYAGAVDLLDWGLEQLLAVLIEAWGEEPTLIAVAAAQGGMPGERAFVPENDAALTSDLVQTPLLVHVSPGGATGRRSELVQTVDLAVTLLDWFKVAEGEFITEGRSLLPLTRGDDGVASRPYICLGRGSEFGGVRTPDLSLTASAEALAGRSLKGLRLFAKPDDVWDVHDVASQSPALAEGLASIWCEFVQNARAGVPVEWPELPSAGG